MDRHPLVEWIESLFAIHSYNYRYRDVLRFENGIIYANESTRYF